MIPDFALHLSFEGISLLHRTAQGWASLGEVPLDSADLGGALAVLRKSGLDSATPWRGTKVLLPPEQVRAVAFDGLLGPTEARAALEGLTPYAVLDLVVDVVHHDGRTHVAAVARETLAEAEAFADEHGFAPVCFASALGAAGFPGEAFFGPTQAAAGILGDQAVLRDPETLAPGAVAVALAAEPAMEVSPVEEPVAEAIPEGPAPAEPAPEPEDLAAGVVLGAGNATVPPKEPAALSDLAAAEPLAGQEPAPTLPATAQEAPAVPEESTEAEPPAAAVAPGMPEASPVPHPAAAVPEPVVASRSHPPIGQGRGIGPAPARMPPPGRAEPRVGQGSAAGWAPGAPTIGRPDPRITPRTSSPSEPAQPEAAAAHKAESTRPEGKAARRSRRHTEPQRSRIGGKPRFLGLILTVILLLVMAGVALFTAGPERIAGLFRQAEPTAALAETQAGAPPASVTEAPAPVAPETLAGTTPGNYPALVTPDDEPAPAEAIAAAQPEPATSDMPSEAVAPTPAASEAASAAVAAAIAALPRPSQADGASVDPSDTDRFYAATGVWLAAPRAPALPFAEQAAAPALPATSAEKSLPGLPVLAATEPDAPPVPGAAAEPILVAERITALPRQLPPTRPAEGSAAGEAEEPAFASPMSEPPSARIPDRPEAPAGLAAQPAGAPEAKAEPRANAMAEAPAARIPARPEAPPEMLAALAAPAAAAPDALALAAPAAPLGGVNLAGLRPAPRPEGFSPDLPEPAPTILASYDGPRPGPRPEGIAPEDLPTADVSDALAEALAQPEPSSEPEAPATPDLQSTLAAIVQGAPDPLAGATRQAVAMARVPDVRPRNFNRVVESQLARQSRAARPQENRAPAGGTGASGLAAHEEAEAAEVASSAAAVPSGPTATTVAQAATRGDAIALREINLIGVYGQPGARRALVRMENGRYLRVGVGDALDGGQVTAIGDNALNYVRRGRTIALVIPGG